MLRTIVRNVLSNWANEAVGAIVGFFMAPYLVHMLGNEGYGTWTMIVALTGYVLLLDLGVYQGVLQYATRYHATGETALLNETVSTATLVLSVAAAIGIVASGAMAWLCPRYIAVENIPMARVQWALFIAGTGVSLTIVLDMYNAIIVACQSFHLLNASTVAVRLVSAGALVWTLSQGMDLLSVAIVVSVANLLGQIVRVWIAHRLVPHLRVRPRFICRSAMERLFGYGVWMFAIRLSRMLLGNIDLVIIGISYGAVGAAFYGIAVTLISYAQAAINGVSFVLTPIAIMGDARAEMWRMRSLLLRSSRVGLVLGGVFFLGFAFWGKEFVAQWMGAAYVSGEEFTSSATILVVAALGRVLAGGLVGPPQVLTAMRRVRLLALITAISGGLAAIVICLCAKFAGPIAVAAATTCGLIVAQVVVTVYACRFVGVTFTQFIWGAVLPPLLALAVTAAASIAIGLLITCTGWPGVFSRIVASGLVSVVVGGYLCFKREERRSAIERVVARFRARC